MMILANANNDINIVDSIILSVLGFALVMAVLCILMGIIYLMSYLLKKTDGKQINYKKIFNKVFRRGAEEESVVAEEVQAEPQAELAKGSAGEVRLNNVEPATAAMLMAIVADALAAPINELRFVSIRELSEKGE